VGGRGGTVESAYDIEYPAELQRVRGIAEGLINSGDIGNEIWRGLANIYERQEQPY
jgi:hypothetical protein